MLERALLFVALVLWVAIPFVPFIGIAMVNAVGVK